MIFKNSKMSIISYGINRTFLKSIILIFIYFLIIWNSRYNHISNQVYNIVQLTLQSQIEKQETWQREMLMTKEKNRI